MSFENFLIIGRLKNLYTQLKIDINELENLRDEFEKKDFKSRMGKLKTKLYLLEFILNGE